MISGFDSDINYAKVARAVSYLRTPGCLFVSTNTDTGLPCGGTCLLPGWYDVLSLSASDGTIRENDRYDTISDKMSRYDTIRKCFAV